MKMITNLNEKTHEINETLMSFHSHEMILENILSDHRIEDSIDQIEGIKLLSHIQIQLDQIYKENKKRQYLIKEISSYLIRK